MLCYTVNAMGDNMNREEAKIKVILDTDTYNECDDDFALLYMLKSQDIFDIKAITVAPFCHEESEEIIENNTLKSYEEILKICKWACFDTHDKVFRGSTGFITNGYNENNEAVDKIIEIALESEKTTILAIGALTNIALAIKKQPKIIASIEIVWLGGHSLLQENNLEFNFKQDVEAVKIVFASQVKLTIIPCKNVASNLRTTIYELKHYIGKSKLGNHLLNRFTNDGFSGVKTRRVLWDIAVIAYVINKTWFTVQKMNCPGINQDTSYKLNCFEHKITMVNYIEINKVYEDFFKKIKEV